MFGCLESEGKKREKRENEGRKQGPVLGMLRINFFLQNVQKMAYIALQTGENTNLT